MLHFDDCHFNKVI